MSFIEAFQLLVLIVLGGVWALAAASRRYPDVDWLRGFSIAFPRLPEERRRKARRRGDLHAGIEFILLGLVLPIGYVMLSTMTFSSISPMEMVLVGLGSLVCIGLGIIAIWHSRRQ